MDKEFAAARPPLAAAWDEGAAAPSGVGQTPPEAGIPPLLSVVGRHGPDGRVVAHHDQKFPCPGQGGVEHPPHHQGLGRRHGRQHHCPVLAALGLMDGLGIGQI